MFDIRLEMSVLVLSGDVYHLKMNF